MPGLDKTIIDRIDFTKSIRRINVDVKTDFIFAPHLNFVYKYASDELIDLVQRRLSGGLFQFSLPIMLNIPKKSKLSRPGSIQLPFDRLIYQALVDLIAPIVESSIDRSRVFSNVYQPSSDNMFQDQSQTYKKFQSFIKKSAGRYKYCLKTDIASYYETLNQHVLVNLLRSLEIDAGIISFLEEALLAWREKNSYGVIQSAFGSDLLGNYYLTNLDYFLQMRKFNYCRFLDDVYVFGNNFNRLKKLLIEMCDKLRRNGLFLNESKTDLNSSVQILRQETELDAMFEKINDMLNRAFEEDSEFFSLDYGFQTEWDEEEAIAKDYTEVEGFKLDLIKVLYSRRDEVKWQRDNIVKFCLPLFTRAHSHYPLDTIKDEIITYPHLIKYYCNYLSTIERDNKDITKIIEDVILSKNLVYEYGRLWLFASLLYRARVKKKLLNEAVGRFENKQTHETIRAICAILISKFGAGIQKRTVRNGYQDESSNFVRSAILFGTQYLSSAERVVCRGAWGGHSELNSLIIRAQKNHSASIPKNKELKKLTSQLRLLIVKKS